LIPLCLVLLLALPARAQSLVPAEVGTSVNGFQDDFTGTGLGAVWKPVGATDIYSVSDGVLHVVTAGGDPNHLLFNGAKYDATTQEVLARIRVLRFGTGDPARGGVGVAVDPTSGAGINYHFRDGSLEGLTGRHISFLDDGRAWGPGNPFSWQLNTWYWIRLRQEPNAVSEGGAKDVFAKIWAADGNTAEPAAWQTWDYIPSRTARTGLAGITAGSSSGTSEFDVDYILIKAEGLPGITVAPASFPQFHPGPVVLTNQPASVTVQACSTATFKIGYDGTPPHRIQWARNGEAIPGATNSTLVLSSVAPADDGAVFTATVRNVDAGVPHSVTSSGAVLRVVVDPVSPELVQVQSVGGLTGLRLVFSKPVAAATASQSGNYQIAAGGLSLPVVSAAVSPDGLQVLLTTQPQTEGTRYTLTLRNLVDACTGTVAMAPNTQASFQAMVYGPLDIGSPATGGSIVSVAGGYDVTGGGIGLTGSSDQLQFSSQPRSGNFDVRVQVAHLSGPDAWSEAGLMVRDSSNPSGRFVSVMATPSVSGVLFKSRAVNGTVLVQSGSYPVNYPDTWLRLKRVGSVFTAFASRDGQAWTQLGSAPVSFGSQVSLGFAVASHHPTLTAVASFRGFSDVVSATAESSVPTSEALGQSNRKTGLVISEIQYHPGAHARVPGAVPGVGQTNRLEFVELFNTMGTPEDLSGYRLDGDIHFTFPAGTTLPGGAFLVVARDPSDLKRVYGIANVVGPFTGSLPNSSGKVQLKNPVGAVFLEANYDSRPPWPVSPDGGGHSLVLSRPSFGENDPRAWSASDQVGGSPGGMDSVGVEPLRALVINEFVAHSGSGAGDFIELYNHSNQPLDISGCGVSDHPETDGYILPAGTVLAPRGHLALSEAKLGFALDAADGSLWLRNPAQTRVLDVVRYEAQSDGVATGRAPDGSPLWRRLATATPGASNAVRRLSDVVIHELLYDPISGVDDDQFVELYNRSDAVVDLAGWQFVDGIQFTFPTNSVIPPHGYFVVSRNAARLLEKQPGLSAAAVTGNFSGSLSHRGERVALARPEVLVQVSAPGMPPVTNTLPVVVSEVTYASGGRWGRWSGGAGSSLELIHPDADPEFASSWSDSDETAKAPWTLISATGTVNNGSSTGDSLQLLLQGAGEALIDNIEVRDDTNANLVANGIFESGIAGWTAEGTMDRTSLETNEGYQSNQSLHLRAVERGDNQVNRVRCRLTSSVRSGTRITITARARWLRGAPSLLMRIRGNWMEAAGALTLPDVAGTPGRANSRASSVPLPGIREVTHSPVLPADSQAVRITARVRAVSDVPAVRLNYRIDPSPSIRSIPMTDDGTGGDEVAGDGLFTATLPGQASGTLVAFTVEARESAASTVASRFPAFDSTGEALIRFGETQPAGNVPTYRIWITQAAFNAWNARSKLNNTPLDCTFVLGNQRAIYNTAALYAGSPYIAPGYCGPNCGRCGYSITFPDDDPFLGSADLVLDWPGGHGNESTALQEQMAYWMAGKMGLPTCNRYPIRLHLNGVTDEQRGTIFEAVNQPASEFLKAWVPNDSGGDFFKVDRGFEFNDGGGLVADPMPTLQVFNTTGGVKKTARYRWNWNKRAGSDPNDYQNIYNLVDAVNTTATEPYTRLTESLVDIEEWMGVFAVEHIINNFDSWGHDIGKNMYAYKPKQGKWQIYLFDLDWLMLAAPAYNATYTAKTGPLFVSNDPVVARMYNHPPFRRAYFRAIQRAVEGPLIGTNCDPVMDAKYASYVANGIRLCDGQTLTSPVSVKTWFRDRRIALQAQLDRVDAPFAVSKTTPASSAVSPVTISGTAPIRLRTLQVNGVELPVTWTSVTNWSANVPLVASTNTLVFTGLDSTGAAIPGLGATVTMRYSGAVGGPARVFINEWMADNATALADTTTGALKYSDWFELFNAGDTAANLAGYYLTDTLARRDQFQIPAGYVIPPGGHLLVWADNQPQLNQPGQPDLHVNFQLAAKGEKIGLFAPDGSPVDAVTFGAQATDVSEGRCPDGSANIVLLPLASPRGGNSCNEPVPRLEWSLTPTGAVHLEWNSIVGTLYAVEAVPQLGAGAWTPVSPAATATAARMSLEVPPDAATSRFLRLRIGQ
jgi:hypothetical protein